MSRAEPWLCRWLHACSSLYCENAQKSTPALSASTLRPVGLTAQRRRKQALFSATGPPRPAPLQRRQYAWGTKRRARWCEVGLRRIKQRPMPTPVHDQVHGTRARIGPPSTGRASKPLALRHRVVWSGTARSRRSRLVTDPIAILRSAATPDRTPPVETAPSGSPRLVVRLTTGCGPVHQPSSRRSPPR